jgi:hypothetical protein
METNNLETLSKLGTQEIVRRQTIERHCQHWVHRKQDEDKYSKDTVNTGHTRNRMKTNNPQTLSTLGIKETGRRQVDSVSRMFVFVLFLVCPVLTVSLDCLSSSCFLCAQCLQFLSNVCLRPVSCVPSVDSVSRLLVFVLFLLCPVLKRHCQNWAHKK